MNIKNLRVYGFKSSVQRAAYPMEFGEPSNLSYDDSNLLEKESQRFKKLGGVKPGTGHDNFLKGIIVQFDLQYEQYFTPQLQRYHWMDFISSQSKMHTITKRGDIRSDCNKWVDEDVILLVNKYIALYNNFEIEIKRLKDMAWNSGAQTLFGEAFDMQLEEKVSVENSDGTRSRYDKQELFMKIISNLPMGFQLWAGMTTNFQQLKTIYLQRKNHKLPEWKWFCNWMLENLPFFDEVVGEK